MLRLGFIFISLFKILKGIASIPFLILFAGLRGMGGSRGATRTARRMARRLR